jgi:tetratricopeptide (TPR) repeat protein
MTVSALRLAVPAAMPARVLVIVLAFLVLAAGPARAGDDESRAAELDRLHAALLEADGTGEAQAIEARIWRIWLTAPDAAAQEMIDEAVARRRLGDLEGARAVLDRLIAERPGYAEGWNQRATILFLEGKDEASLADVAEVLKLRPRHFGALAGRALILLRQGRHDAGQRALLAALRVNPWLAERGLLGPGYEEAPL